MPLDPGIYDALGGNKGTQSSSFDAKAIEEALTTAPKENTSGELSRLVTGEKPALPDTFMGRFTSGALGEAKGAFDIMVEGPAQLLAHTAADIYPKNWPGYEFFQKQKDIAERGKQERQAAFESATRDTSLSAKAGEFAGSVIGAAGLTSKMSGATQGANLFNRMIAAGKAGAVIGAATPTEDKDFWTNKALQTGLTALTAFLGQPVVEGVGKVVGAATNQAVNLGKKVINWATGKTADEVTVQGMKNASPELQKFVKDAVASGKKLDPAALGRQVEADSLPVKMNLTPGQATQDPIAVSNEINLRSKNTAMAYYMQEQNSKLIQNLNVIRENAAPEATAPDVITAGEQLIKAGQATIEKQRDMTTALYKKLADANGGNLPVDGISFVDSAEAALKKQMKSPFLPSQVRTIMEDIKNNKGAMTFENFENLRTILAAAGRTAERSGDGNAVGAISIVRNALEETSFGGNVAGVKGLADAARASARFGFEMLDKNPALKAIDAGKASDHNFVQRYIIGASKKDITNLAEVLQHDTQALQTIKAATVNYLKSSAGVASDNGIFTQAGYNKALQALGPKLDVIFGADEAAHLRTLGNVSRYIQLAPKGSFVNTSNTDVANLARTGGSIAATAIDRATGTPVGTIAKNAAQVAMEKKATAKTLGQIMNVGAGTTSPSNQERFLLQDFPKVAGRAGAVPLSVLLGQSIADKSREKASER